MGYVRELGGEGRWQVTYELGRDPVSLRRRRRSRIVYGTRSDAEAVLVEIEAQVEDGRHSGGGRLTVQGFFDGWAESLRVEVSPSTERGYREKMKHVLDVVGRRRMTSITGDDMNAIYMGLLDRGLAGSSVLHVHTVAHKFFADAVRAGVVSKNPVDAARRPQADDYVFSVWQPEHVQAFVQSLPDDRWRNVWMMAFTFGVRRGELLGAEWKNLRDNRLFINQTVNSDGEILPKPKRASSRRWISIDPATMVAVDRMRETVDGEREFFGPDYQDHGLMVCWEDGRPIRGDTFSKWFRRKRVELGLPHIRLHDLRHTWATMALEANIPARVVQERLGHASVAITLNTYTKVTDRVQDEAAATVASAMGFE